MDAKDVELHAVADTIEATKNRFNVVNNATKLRLLPIEGKPIASTRTLRTPKLNERDCRAKVAMMFRQTLTDCS